MPRSKRPCANIFELQSLEVRRFLTVASISNATHTLNVTGTSGADTITLTRNGNNVTVSGVNGSFAPGSGNNQFNKINIDGAGGNDVITITGTPTGVGTTATTVSYLNATIGGGGGNDTIVGGNGPDVISGGSGFDTVNYSARTVGITVTMDSVANDGKSGENDNITSDNEEVITGSGNDSFTGNANDNFFAGGAGDDTALGGGGNDDLTGSTGKDSLLGQDGDDFLQAKNSDVDTVNGGKNSNGSADLDLAEVDGVDVSSARPAFAALLTPGIDRSQLDATYGIAGKNSGPIQNWDRVAASAIDSQGRVILVGSDFRTNGFGYSSEDMVAMRFNADGTVDTGFGYNGEAVIGFTSGFTNANDDEAFGVTTDSNDNVYIVGSSAASNFGEGFFDSDFAMAKLNSGGQRDSLFGNNGTSIEDFNINESVGGGYNDEAHDAIIDANGNIVVVGQTSNNFSQDVVVMRFTNNGDLDTSFNGSGQAFLDTSGQFQVDDSANAVGLQLNGNSQRIIVAGRSAGSVLVARFNADGTLDSGFGPNESGYTTTQLIEGTFESANDVALDSTHVYIVGDTQFAARGVIGSNPDSAISGIAMRFDVDGIFQLGTQPAGDASSTLTSVVVDPTSGHLIVAGANATNFIWGDLDQTTLTADSAFNGGQFIQTDFTPQADSEWYDIALEVGVTSDGKVLLGGVSDTDNDGDYQTAVARYGAPAAAGPQDDTTDVEKFIGYGDLQTQPPSEPLASHLKNLTTSAKLYVLAQPDENGVAVFNLTNANDNVTITKGVDANGTPQIFVNVNGFVIPYDVDTTTLFRFNMLGGNDTLLTGAGVKVPMRVYAGDGNDLVTTGDGNDLIDGGKGIDILYAGNGNDVVLGGADTDVIGGDGGNDLVIGGTGVDGLFGGGSGEDILIGGTTSYDTNEAALLAIIDEWGSSASNSDRINHLKGTLPGGLNGSFFLKSGTGATVFNDTSVDGLTGGSGRDWFFRKNSSPNKDSILDNTSGEEVTNM